MPWDIRKRGDEWCVIKRENGEVEGCHPSREDANDQLAALNIAESESKMSRRSNDKQRHKREQMYAHATFKALSRARTPDYDGTETISWSDVPKTFANFRDGYYKHSGASRPDDLPGSVGALPAAAKTWIASKSLLGDPRAETFADLVFFPVVNPDTDNLNAGALRAVLGGRGAQANIPRSALDSARAKARSLLDDEYGEERSLEKDAEEKDGMMGYVEAFGGAKSWGELDEYLEAQDMVHATRQATFEFETLLGNVLTDPMVSLAEKSEMIAALAADLPSRVAMLREKDDETEDEPTEMEPGVLGAIKQIFKASKVVDGHRLMAGDFAHVGDPEDPRTWAFPLVSESGRPDARKIAGAIEGLKGGGPSARPSSMSRPMVMSRIRSAITRAEASDKVKEELRIRLAEVKALDVNSFHVFKDNLGRFRWFGWVTNKWRDRDESAAPEKGGEILTEDAHKDYVSWVDKEPGKRLPELWAWHTKETAHSHRADWLDYADGFVLMSGPLTDDEAKGIERVAGEYDLGMSHGFYALDRDEKDALITKYRTFEVSFLPRELAANPWTDFVTLHKEADMAMSDSKRSFLSKLAGDDFVEEIERETGEKAGALAEAGVDFKDKEEATEDAAAVVEAQEDAETVAEAETVDDQPEVVADPEPVAAVETDAEGAEIGEAIGVIAKSIADTNTIIEKLAEKLDGIEGRLDAVERDDETKVAEKASLTPRMSIADHVRSVIGNPDAKVDGSTALAKAGPEEAEAHVPGATGIPVLDRFKQLSASGGR